MKLNTDQSTIVAVGDWNPRIFLPEWVLPNLFSAHPAAEPELEYLLQPTGGRPFRIRINDLIIMPDSSRLAVGVQHADDDVLREAERVMRVALECLTHTPIRALGINLGFHEPEPPSSAIDLFRLSDLNALSHQGYDVSETVLQRKLTRDDAVLNLKQTLVDSLLSLDFNFHYSVTSTQAAAALLDGDCITQHKHVAAGIMAELYNLHLDESDDND